MPVSTTARRTQADRSASTRAALSHAAIEVLIERGWAALTAIEVCERAGVTRGAFHHHYDSLPDLLADALRRLYAHMVPAGHPQPIGVVDLVDVTWAAIGHRRFKAVLEAWLAMANDPSLHAEIGPVVAEFSSLVNPSAFTSLLSDARRRDFFITARETMLGLALGRATNGGKALSHERRVLARIRAEAATMESD
jgi:AcrR family transcriptional regulator